MTQLSIPWTANSTGDGRAYTALEFSNFQRYLYLGGSEATDGVVKGVQNELAVTGSSSPLSINTGAAVVYGKVYQNDASTTVTVTTPSVGTTGGHVVLQLDWVAQTVRVANVRNTDGISAIPALVQSLSTVWEIELATYTITTGGVITLTDARHYCHYGQRVATANIDDSAVTTVKIADANVTAAKLANDSVTAAKIVDGTVGTTEMADNAISTPKILDGAVSTAKLTNDSVDDTKVGNRVAQFYRRQGGDATHWDNTGTTDYTPTAVRQQCGNIHWNGAGASSGLVSVTFPVAFSARPFVMVSAWDSANSKPLPAWGVVIDATEVSLRWNNPSGASITNVDLAWFAIGTE